LLSRTLTLNLLTTTIVAPPSKASKWQMGFNSEFKGLIRYSVLEYIGIPGLKTLEINCNMLVSHVCGWGGQ